MMVQGLSEIPADSAIFRVAGGDPAGRSRMFCAVRSWLEPLAGVESHRLALDFLWTYRHTRFGRGCPLLDQVERFAAVRGYDRSYVRELIRVRLLARAGA